MAAQAAHPTVVASRRAWITVAAGAAVFALMAAAAIFGVGWVYEHATTQRDATATVISGQDALWRASPDDEWTIVNSSITLREGDEISTELGTVVWITVFDGSTLEVTEQSHIRLQRSRSSRFSDESIQIQVDLLQGAVYAAMAPLTSHAYGELEILTPNVQALLRAERARPANPSPSIVVETTPRSMTGTATTRAAAFRGQLTVVSGAQRAELVGPEQVDFEDGTLAGRSASIQSQMIANGDFEHGQEGWDTSYSAEAREPRDRIGVAEVIALEDSVAVQALHIARAESSVWARTGVSQQIDRTLRLPTTLTLSFDIKIDDQSQPLDGRATVPVAVELNYVDVLGQDREWTTAFTLRRADGGIDADAVTELSRGEWTKVIVNLENLEPIPKTLRTMVVYASGGGYDSAIANLSLTTSEGSTSP